LRVWFDAAENKAKALVPYYSKIDPLRRACQGELRLLSSQRKPKATHPAARCEASSKRNRWSSSAAIRLVLLAWPDSIPI
jgi:hypothetical protein